MQLCDNNEGFTFSVCSFIGTHFFVFRRVDMKNDAEKNDAEMYREMYGTLFCAICTVIEDCKDEEAVELLKEAQLAAEDIFITYYE